MKVCSVCRRCFDDSVVSCTEAGHPPLSETRYGRPEMIAGYRLDYLLESGFSSDIYRAGQTASGRSCRITILSTDPQSSQQFLGEAKIAAALFHPNVVDVYEAGSLESGEDFVIAEDPDGQSLRDLLNTVGVPHLLTSIQVVRQTAEALHVLHLKGLTHRAVSPENIILTTDAEHRLLVRIKDPDFGGVIERSIVSNKFFIDNAIDSLKYFAPEQCSAEPVSMKTDVYSLGVVLYEMLAGVPPFDADKAAALIEKHRNQRPPEIRIDNFELRMLLTHTLMESLTKRPEKRQSSANAFARQMRHIEQLATHVSTPPPAGVVPAATPRTSALAAAAAAPVPRPAVIQPTVVREMRKVTYTEVIQPVTAMIENKPVPVFKAESDSPFTTLKDESKAAVMTERGGPASDPAAVPHLLPEEPVVENVVPVIEAIQKERSVPPVSRLSRLRMRMKKLHPRTEPQTSEKPNHRAFPAVEPVEVTPVQVVPEKREVCEASPATVPLHRAPAKIEWDQPEDNIPSIADVIEILSKEQTGEAPAVHLEPEKIAAAMLRRQPAKIERNQPENDIPLKVEALARRSNEQLPETPAVRAEPEEITLVSAPGKRIRIDLDRPAVPQYRRPYKRSSPQNAYEVGFFPTILGDAGNGKTIDPDPKDSMFGAYYPSSQARFSAPYRSLVIGGGVAVALIVLFLFGDDIVQSYSPSADLGGRSAAKIVTRQEPRPGQTEVVTPARQEVHNNFRKPMPENEEPIRAGFASKLSKSPTAGRSSGKAPDDSKTRPRTEPEKKSADKKPPSGLSKTAPLTRPRIVKEREP